MSTQEIKSGFCDEMKGRINGKKGTPKRDDYEEELQMLLLDEKPNSLLSEGKKAALLKI